MWGPLAPYRGIDFRERDTLSALMDACMAITKCLTPTAAILASLIQSLRPLADAAQPKKRYIDVTVVTSLVAEATTAMLAAIDAESHERSHALAMGCVKDMGVALDAWQAN